MALYNWTDGELVTADKLNAYGESMEQLKTDTVSAKTAAQEAKEDAETAKNTAENASTSAQAAKTAAETAQTKAETANASAQQAKANAQTAAQSAGTAKENAQASAASAAADAQRAEDAVAHNPAIQNGIWYVWNPETGAYMSTDVPATGQMTVEVTYQQGDSATTPPTGMWLASPPEVSQGKYLWTKDFFSDGTIGYSVARQGIDGTGAVVSVNGKSGEVTLTTDDISEGTKKYVTAAEKNKLENAPDDTTSALEGKVDKATGKQLSTDDYTTADKDKVTNLPANTNTALAGKVDKTAGKGLSTNDYTTAEKNKVANLPANTNAELNKKANTSDVYSKTDADERFAKTVTYTATVGTAWTAKTGYVQQTITVNGILATDNPIIDLVATTADFEAQQKAWGKIFKVTTAANSITLYASEATEKAISLQLKVVR